MFCMRAPSQGRTTLVPPETADSTTRRTISEGIANPMPLEPMDIPLGPKDVLAVDPH
jgi:hypothetical protein